LIFIYRLYVKNKINETDNVVKADTQPTFHVLTTTPLLDKAIKGHPETGYSHRHIQATTAWHPETGYSHRLIQATTAGHPETGYSHRLIQASTAGHPEGTKQKPGVDIRSTKGGGGQVMCEINIKPKTEAMFT
jgi:hypothetical protein